MSLIYSSQRVQTANRGRRQCHAHTNAAAALRHWQQKRRQLLHAASADSAGTSTSSSVISSRYGDLAWASCVSSKPTVNSAVQDAVDSIMAQQQGAFEPDLALVFASCNYGSQLQTVVQAVRRAAPSVRRIFGCSAYGVLGSSPGGPLEIEGEPGISLTLAALPGVELSVLHTLRSSIPTEDAPPDAWCDLVGMSPLEVLSPSPSPPPDTDEPQTAEQQQEASSDSSDSSSRPEEAGSSLKALSSSRISGSNEQASAAEAAVSFLVLCDPRFQQSKQLLAGLDFAFPASNKVGAVLSQGQQNKRRLMFVWSADGSVQPGTAAWARQQQKRRQAQLAASQSSTPDSSSSSSSSSQAEQQQLQLQLQQQAAQQPDQAVVEQPAAAASSQVGKKRGLFGNLFNALLSGLSEEEEQQKQTQASSSNRQLSDAAPASSVQVSSSSAGHQVSGGPAAAAAAGELPDSGLEGDGPDDDGSGVFMYGAAVLGIKGPLTLEPITCQGYRTVSDKVWTVGQTSRDGDLIATLIAPEGGDEGGRGDSSDGGEGEAEAEAEVVPLIAVYDLLMSAGYDAETTPPEFIEELSTKLAVAIAPDSWTPVSELSTDDFTVAALSEVWQRTGCIRVEGQARPGYRLKLVLRDEAGIREDLASKLLGLKRTELAGVLEGRVRPPPLAALLLSDIGRGSSLYDTPSYESGVVSSYLPVPLSGMFGSAQVSTVNKKATLYELTSAIAVLRPLASATSSQSSLQLGVSPSS